MRRKDDYMMTPGQTNLKDMRDAIKMLHFADSLPIILLISRVETAPSHRVFLFPHTSPFLISKNAMVKKAHSRVLPDDISGGEMMIENDF